MAAQIPSNGLNIDKGLSFPATISAQSGANVLDDNISVEDTTELLDSYIEAVETYLNKDRMKTTMRGLYVEAQDREIL